jgi:hypothetical protein
MSATNRGGERRDRDFYPTPAWCVRRLLDELPLRMMQGNWLEPAAGDGAIVRAVRRWNVGASRENRIRWTSTDIVAPSRRPPPGFAVRDYLTWKLQVHAFDVAITNPPFCLDEVFVEKMRRDAKVAIALLRLDWIASAERNPLMRRHPPDLYVLPDRPSFTGDGETDAQTYGWFVWGLGRGGSYRVLETTSLAERKAAA